MILAESSIELHKLFKLALKLGAWSFGSWFGVAIFLVLDIIDSSFLFVLKNFVGSAEL